MKTEYIVTVLMLLLMSSPMNAQRKKVIKPKVQVEQKQQIPEWQLYKSFIPSTAKLMFVDSVVVDKSAFLTLIPLNQESGTIMEYKEFFHKEQEGEKTGVYINEFSDKIYFAEGDTTQTRLYTVDKFGGQWQQPLLVSEIDDSTFKFQNYPFMASDGVTFYFAAKGEKSIGGYDLFTTNFDAEEGRFYEPQNMGLPYNSTANDYMIAYDELDTLGWLVTDRNQSTGKVCIYTFVPTSTRQTFENDDLTDKELEKFAQLKSIADTWQFGDREAALARTEKLKARIQGSADTRKSNDAKSALEKQLNEIEKMQKSNKLLLERLRESYHNGNRQTQIKEAIIKAEKDQNNLNRDLNIIKKKVNKEKYSLK